MIDFALPTQLSDLLLRESLLILGIVWQVYWKISEIVADKGKPKQIRKISIFHRIERYSLRVLYFLVALQLIGLSLFPMQISVAVQTGGFLLALMGFTISMLGRKHLGTNWAHAVEYQIKKMQELVTTGIYRYVRHPIYSGIALFIIGAEIVAKSYLFLPCIVILFAGAYLQGKKEEKLLLSHFGEKYKRYMIQSKMLIPFVW